MVWHGTWLGPLFSITSITLLLTVTEASVVALELATGLEGGTRLLGRSAGSAMPLYWHVVMVSIYTRCLPTALHCLLMDGCNESSAE